MTTINKLSVLIEATLSKEDMESIRHVEGKCAEALSDAIPRRITAALLVNAAVPSSPAIQEYFSGEIASYWRRQILIRYGLLP